MKFSLTVALSLASGVFATGNLGGCNANNCARGVTGTRVGKKPDVTSRFEDCESFQLTTVTPAVSTSTATVTIYTDSPPAPVNPDFGPAVPAVTVIPSDVPAYASSCNGPEGFASACSCWGATATATTVATPVVTVTTTAYVGTGCKYPFVCPIPIINQWNCGNGKKCTCLKGVDGQKLCVQNGNCFSAKTCTKHSDCAADEGCVVDTCCGVLARKGRICLKYAPGQCPNTLFPRDVFQKRQEEEVETEEPEIGCTAFGCPDEEIIEDQMRR